MSESTVREAIVAAVGAAEAERSAVLKAARLNGVTLRTLADLLDVAPSTVMRWAPLEGEPNPNVFLDFPATAVR